MEIINLCTSCVQVITNPICPNCFSKHVINWLRDRNLPNYNINIIKKQLRKLVNESEETPSNNKCIICGTKRVNLCTYCFTNKALDIIEKNTLEEIQNKFNNDFSTKILTKPFV